MPGFLEVTPFCFPDYVALYIAQPDLSRIAGIKCVNCDSAEPTETTASSSTLLLMSPSPADEPCSHSGASECVLIFRVGLFCDPT